MKNKQTNKNKKAHRQTYAKVIADCQPQTQTQQVWSVTTVQPTAMVARWVRARLAPATTLLSPIILTSCLMPGCREASRHPSRIGPSQVCRSRQRTPPQTWWTPSPDTVWSFRPWRRLSVCTGRQTWKEDHFIHHKQTGSPTEYRSMHHPGYRPHLQAADPGSISNPCRLSVSRFG